MPIRINGGVGMSIPTMNLLSVPGVALLDLERLRDSGSGVRASIAALQVQADISDLTVTMLMNHLPQPDFAWSPYGVVGTFHSGHATDKLVEYAVREWAQAFSSDVAVMEPVVVGRDRDGKAIVDPGWVVMHASVRGLGFTIGGRLTELPEVAW
jgi:hypothetical protein